MASLRAGPWAPTLMTGGALLGEGPPRPLVLRTAVLLDCRDTYPTSHWRGAQNDPPRHALA